jgi:hypothetical protein
MLGVYFFVPSPFSGAGCVPPSPSTDWVLFQFTVCFQFCGAVSFGFCSLAQEMISVIHYLPCFGEWLISAHSLSSLPFLCLFTDSSALKPALAPLPFSGAVSMFHLPSPLSVLDYSLLFVIQFCWGWRESSLPRGCAGFCSQGWIGEFHMVCGAHLFGLPIDTQQVCRWQQWQEKAPDFLSIMWHGEAFHGLGVQDVESLISCWCLIST